MRYSLTNFFKTVSVFWDKQYISPIILSGYTILILFFAHYNSVFEYSHTPKIFSSLLFFSIISIFFKSKIEINFPKIFLIPILAMLLFLLIGITKSYNIGTAFYKIFPILVSFLLLKTLLQQFKSTEAFIKTISIFITISVIVLSCLTIIPILSSMIDHTYSHQLTYTFSHSFGHRNVFSGVLVLSFPLVLSGLILTKQLAIKILHGIALNLICITIVVLMARSAILALVIMVVIISIYSLFKGTNGKRKIRLTLLLLVVIIGYFSMVLYLKDSSKDFNILLRDFTAITHGSGQERQEIWKNTLELCRQNLLFGGGTDNWRVDILQQNFEEARGVNDNVYFQRTHNDYLQILYENGLVGLLNYIGIFIISIALLFQSKTFDSLIKVILFSGVLAFMLISSFSFPFERIDLLFLTWCLIIPTFSYQRKKEKAGKLFFLIPATLLIFVSLRFNAEKKLFDAREKEIKGHSGLAQKKYEKVNDYLLSIDQTATPIDWYKGNIKFKQGNFNAALTDFLEAETHAPFHPHVLNNIAACYYHIDNLELAETYYISSLNYHPKFSDAILNYSAFLFNSSRVEESLNTILRIPIKYEPPNYSEFYLSIIKKYINQLPPKNKNYQKLQRLLLSDDELIKLGNICRERNLTIAKALAVSKE